MLDGTTEGPALAYLGREIPQQIGLGHERPHLGVAVHPLYVCVYDCVVVGMVGI